MGTAVLRPSLRRASGRSALAIAIVATVALAVPSVAWATWSSSGSGAASGAAATMPTGAAPGATAGTSSVALSWTAVTLSDGAPVTGYVITRYNQSGTSYTVNANCSGVVTTTSCTELSVPAGTWTYTDTPVVANWTGGESQRSAAVIVPS
jgi:hypothetical protein